MSLLTRLGGSRKVSHVTSFYRLGCCADLTDVTLADEDTNSILTDNANRALQGNVATQVTQPGGQLWNQAMQVTWPNFESICNKSEMHTQKKYKYDFKRNIAHLKFRNTTSQSRFSSQTEQTLS